jgi:hypothetical protein
MADQAQGDTKAGWCKEASVLLVRNLPDFSKYSRVQSRLFEELDSDLSRHHSDTFGICLSEELAIDSFLIRGEVQIRSSCQSRYVVSLDHKPPWMGIHSNHVLTGDERMLAVSPGSAPLLSAMLMVVVA